MYSEWLATHAPEKINFDHVIIPDAACRKFWNAVPADVRNAVFYRLDETRGLAWPQLPATLCLDFLRTGNRSNFEDLYFEKRHRLSRLVIAECIEHNGVYVDDILNGLQSIAEEAFWGVSAHYPKPDRCEMPDGQRQLYIDLFAAETASLLTWAKYLLKDELTAVAPELVLYLETELERRIVAPFLEYKGYWWMGYDRSKRARLNNWTPWITSNVLTVFLLHEQSFSQKRRGIVKCLEIQDAYLGDVPEDGGIDEGVSYWDHAVGSVLETVWMLDRATGGEMAFYHDLHLDRMVSFVRNMNVSGTWFVNFNDAEPRPTVDVGTMWSYGCRSGKREYCAFAAQMVAANPLPFSVGNLHQFLCILPYIDEIRNAKFGPLPKDDAYYRDIQVITAHSHSGNDNGFFLAAKGHHNGESHNHNDVGSFMLYIDGEPEVIDAGNMTYTAKTFSAARYTLWNVRSVYHNVPIIGGQEQLPGKEHCALSCRKTDGGMTLALQKAYGEEAGIRAYTRSFALDENGTLTLRDSLSLERAKRAEFVLMLRHEPECRQGTIRAGKLKIRYPEQCSFACEEIKVTDKRMAKCFPGSIYRVILRAENAAEYDETFVFEADREI